MNRSLRIALLLNPFDFKVKGGEYAPQLARELLGRGHTVRGFGAPEGVIPRSGDDPAPADEFGEPEGRGVIAFRPDAIVAYDGLSPAAFLGARAARKLHIPLVLVEAGMTLGGRLHERLFRWVGEKLWGAYVRRYAQTLIALDPVAREQARAEGFKDEVVQLLPQGVDLNTFRPGLTSNLLTRHRIGGRVLLYVGRVAGERGLEVLISAFAATVGQGRDWSLVFAGGGPSSARQALRAQVDRLGVGASVHWLPTPRPEELPGLLGSATLLVVPAIDNRVRGIYIPCALACGLPVLASDLPRLSHLMQDDGCGLLVEAGAVEPWTDALRRACGSPEVRKRWGLRGREIAQERLDWSVIAEAVEDMLCAACDRPAELAIQEQAASTQS